jgi:hypothetical protein
MENKPKTEPLIHVTKSGDEGVARIEGKLEDVANLLEVLFELIKKDEQLIKALIVADLHVGLIPLAMKIKAGIVSDMVNSKQRTIN